MSSLKKDSKPVAANTVSWLHYSDKTVAVQTSLVICCVTASLRPTCRGNHTQTYVADAMTHTCTETIVHSAALKIRVMNPHV